MDWHKIITYIQKRYLNISISVTELPRKTKRKNKFKIQDFTHEKLFNIEIIK